MGWNYRLVKKLHIDETGVLPPEEITAIHEVYYDEHGQPNGCTVESVHVYSEDGADGIREVLEKMLQACDKPVLDYDSGFKPNKTASPCACEETMELGNEDSGC